MEKFLKSIEKSELNNPLLTAALQEVERLNSLIYTAKEILEATVKNTTCQINGGVPYHPTFDQLNDSKVDMLSDLLF